MQNIRAMLVDDEPLVLENVKYLMRQFPHVEIVYESTSSPQVLRDVAAWDNVDIAVMDINMPEMNGIELSREIFRINPAIRIIFLTAFEEYVMEAMDTNIVDYILKPVTARRLQRTLEKLDRMITDEREKSAQAIRNEEENSDRRFAALKDNQYFMIDWKDGCCITIEGRDIVLYTKYGRYFLRNSLNEWDAVLSPHGWLRCHRAFLINPEHIVSVSPMVNSTMTLQMEGCPAEIPVSRSYINEFRKRVGV